MRVSSAISFKQRPFRPFPCILGRARLPMKRPEG
jgi:hypothetical protein